MKYYVTLVERVTYMLGTKKFSQGVRQEVSKAEYDYLTERMTGMVQIRGGVPSTVAVPIFKGEQFAEDAIVPASAAVAPAVAAAAPAAAAPAKAPTAPRRTAQPKAPAPPPPDEKAPAALPPPAPLEPARRVETEEEHNGEE